MNVLIIDDDKFFRTLFEAEFRQVNAEVTLASDGEEGLALAKKIHPDVIICDLILQKKDGFELLADLTKTPEGKNAKIFVFSSLAQEHDKEEALNLGAHAYFFKGKQTVQDVVQAACSLE
jgi:two-component system, OmpR family, alkaline phosphatase synthesis response regulator PhoP